MTTRQPPAHMRSYRVQAGFDEIWDYLQVAIADRGIKVNNVSHIGDMLERTGRDVGSDRPIYTQARAVEFCSAVLSRRMMEADPHNIVFCPYVIAVYQLVADPGHVHVAYRLPPPAADPASHKALQEVEALLDAISREAVGR